VVLLKLLEQPVYFLLHQQHLVYLRHQSLHQLLQFHLLPELLFHHRHHRQQLLFQKLNRLHYLEKQQDLRP